MLYDLSLVPGNKLLAHIHSRDLSPVFGALYSEDTTSHSRLLNTILVFVNPSERFPSVELILRKLAVSWSEIQGLDPRCERTQARGAWSRASDFGLDRFSAAPPVP